MSRCVELSIRQPSSQVTYIVEILDSQGLSTLIFKSECPISPKANLFFVRAVGVARSILTLVRHVFVECRFLASQGEIAVKNSAMVNFGPLDHNYHGKVVDRK